MHCHGFPGTDAPGCLDVRKNVQSITSASGDLVLMLMGRVKPTIYHAESMCFYGQLLFELGTKFHIDSFLYLFRQFRADLDVKLATFLFDANSMQF